MVNFLWKAEWIDIIVKKFKKKAKMITLSESNSSIQRDKLFPKNEKWEWEDLVESILEMMMMWQINNDGNFYVKETIYDLLGPIKLRLWIFKKEEDFGTDEKLM